MISKIKDQYQEEDTCSQRFTNEKPTRKLNKEQFGNCRICVNKANGIHYGVASCEGCKVVKY